MEKHSGVFPKRITGEPDRFVSHSLLDTIGELGPVIESTEPVEEFVFGLSAVAALKRAARGAKALRHQYVGNEHILMSLLSETSGGAAQIAAHKIDTVPARRTLIRECSWVIRHQ